MIARKLCVGSILMSALLWQSAAIASPQIIPTKETSASPNWIPTAQYQQRVLHGFQIYISPAAWQQNRLGTAVALRAIEHQLGDVSRQLPPAQLAVLRQATIWIELTNLGNAASFHPSATWLRDNNINPDKTESIEIPLSRFLTQEPTQRRVIWHELAHAYHFLAFGNNHPDLTRAYENALSQGLYQRVPHFEEPSQDAYARTNAGEYFSELTEAYFGRNDFYPFVRQELLEYDPVGYQVIKQMWGLVDDD